MMDKEKVYLDDTENSLYIEAADEDGLHICEQIGDGKVYVYLSEIPVLIKKLQECCR